MRRWLGAAALLGLLAGGAQAQETCDSAYEVAAGETLVSIARALYGDAEKWTLLFYANRETIPPATLAVAEGQRLTVPCLPQATLVAQEPEAPGTVDLTLVTRADFAPFTDPDWPQGGLVTDLVRNALQVSPEPMRFDIDWQGGAGTLGPLLAEKRFDMGFPVMKPDCATTPDLPECSAFHYSDPLLDVIVLLFVRAGSGMVFDSDADVIGKRICRPEGHATHDLDRPDRRWLSDGQITLERRPDAPACFEALVDGAVDAVSVNVFLGAQSLADMGLKGQVVPLDRPVSTQSLHLMISKTHWRGTTHLYRVNAGLRALKAGPLYGEIVTRHLATFWDRLQAR